MSLLRRLFGRAKHPSWAPFFTDGELEAFLNLCLARVDHDGLMPELHLEEGFLTFKGRSGEVGLHNLAANCSHFDSDEWSDIIDDFFSQILPMVKGEFPELPSDPAGLRIRITPVNEGQLDPIVKREFAPGLLKCLAYDLPRTVQFVRHEDLDRFEMEEDALFDRALENVLAFEEAERVPLGDGEFESLFAIRGDSIYAASHVLAVEHHLGEVEEPGLVLAVPARNWILGARLDYGSAEDPIRTLRFLSGRMFEDMPGGIVPDIFWWNRGRFQLIPSQFVDGAIAIDLPREMVRALSRPGLGSHFAG